MAGTLRREGIILADKADLLLNTRGHTERALFPRDLLTFNPIECALIRVIQGMVSPIPTVVRSATGSQFVTAKTR